MSGKKIRRTLASVAAVAMLAGAVAAPVMSVSAGQLIGETSFDYKAIPWKTYESSPAKQYYVIEDGKLHVKIIRAKGDDGEKWDLQLRHRDLNFRAGHTYEVSFKAKAKRDGMQLCSKIGNISGDEEYFVLNGTQMEMGPHMGGDWGTAATLTKNYQIFSGTFTPTKDIEAAEWSFHYANGTEYEGNAVDGDEIWFDDMSIECTTCEDCGIHRNTQFGYGAVSRDYGANADISSYAPDGSLVNFISVNQIGYYPKLSKVAVLGDNKGDVLYNASAIDLTEDTYDFEVCDAKTGDVVYSGTSEKKMYDEDSKDNVCKLDFTEFQEPGRYYIKAGDWRSFEFNISDNIYSDNSNNMLTNVLNYFYQNRSGVDIEKDYITSGNSSMLAHEGGHKTDTASVQKIRKSDYLSKDEAADTYASSRITSNGGWYGAGDYGKYVVNGGISVWTLQNMYERAIRTEDGVKKFADASGTVVIPESGNDIPDILDEAAYEIDWMSTMVVQPDDPVWGKYAGMVYHQISDHKWTGFAVRPYDYVGEYGIERIAKPPTFAATLNYAACSAQAARLWEPYDPVKAAKYLDEAKKAYNAFEENMYEAAPDEYTNEESLYAPEHQLYASQEMSYGDNKVRDDAYWAACEIFVSAKKMGDPDADTFFTKLSEYKEAFKVTSDIPDGDGFGSLLSTFDWANTASAGTLTLSLHKDLLPEKKAKKVEDEIIAAADKYLETEDKQGYGIPYYAVTLFENPSSYQPDIITNGYRQGSNSVVINNAMVMAYAYDQTGEDKYISGVTTAMDYLLGTNPLSFSYITGYGTYHVTNPSHRYWSHELDYTLPMAPDGVLSGGPNVCLNDPYVLGLGFIPGMAENPSQRCYVDSVEAWSTNEVSISYNSSLAWVVSFLQDEAADKDVKAVNYGDLDLDGKVDLTDLTQLSQYLIGDTELSPKSMKTADCDGDGDVSISDLPYLKQYIMKDNITLGPKK